MPRTDSVVEAEIARFEAMAAEWWDPQGKFKPLHMLNPCRLGYIVDQIAAEFGRDPAAEAPLRGLRLLDVGCGGGLLCEPMARLGAEVVGADAGAGAVRAARLHAEAAGLAIDYRHAAAEELAARGESFDILLAMEIVEHVADPQEFLRACAALLRPGGLLICSTINRTAKSWLVAIVGAERIMRWLPVGTHDWRRFLTPDELAELIRGAGLRPADRAGFVFDPLRWSWSVSARDLSVNHVAAAVKPGG